VIERDGSPAANARAVAGRLERRLSCISARGSERKDFLDRMATNDLATLAAGDGAPTFLLERTGRVVDRLLVLERGEDALLVGSPGRADAVLEWLTKHVIADDVELRDVSAETRIVTVLGDAALDVMQERLEVVAADLAPWEHRRAAPSFGDTIVARAEDVGGRSFLVIVAAAAFAAVDGAIATLPPLSGADYRALRIAAGVPTFGEEFDERSIPLELRAADHISFTKGCYVGQEVIARLHNFHRVKRALVRVRVEGVETPAAGAELLEGAQTIGRVASAASVAGDTFALAFVDPGRETPRPHLVLRDGARRRAAEILTLTPAGDPS
jgi:tRNA-modifying protein YgfZ